MHKTSANKTFIRYIRIEWEKSGIHHDNENGKRRNFVLSIRERDDSAAAHRIKTSDKAKRDVPLFHFPVISSFASYSLALVTSIRLKLLFVYIVAAVVFSFFPSYARCLCGATLLRISANIVEVRYSSRSVSINSVCLPPPIRRASDVRLHKGENKLLCSVFAAKHYKWHFPDSVFTQKHTNCHPSHRASSLRVHARRFIEKEMKMYCC